jgi:UDP-N-acetylenolpyruvoylglucosamine reductase
VSYTIDGAHLSTLNASFFGVMGVCTSDDIKQLSGMVRRLIIECSGIALEWKIRYVGIAD